MADVMQHVLLGFDVSIADIGDRMRFCRPLLSSADGTVYVAGRNWDESSELVAVDISEAEKLATVLPSHNQRPISPRQGVVVAGSGFARAADQAGIKLDICTDEIESGHRIGLAPAEAYVQFRHDVVKQARNMFDKDLERSIEDTTSISERGLAALFLLRTCSIPDEDLAQRQLASSLQDYMRLLTGFALELDMSEEEMHQSVLQYMQDSPVVDLLDRRHLPAVEDEMHGKFLQHEHSLDVDLFVALRSLAAEQDMHMRVLRGKMPPVDLPALEKIRQKDSREVKCALDPSKLGFFSRKTQANESLASASGLICSDARDKRTVVRTLEHQTSSVLHGAMS